MAKKNKLKLGFDKRGGVLAVSRAMRESDAYESMPSTAKVLMDLLHLQWRNDRPVAYGVREAAEKIGCTPNTAGKAFKILHERGFIVCVNESFFNSKSGSKAREWRLTWMPFECRNPTHDWEKWQPEKLTKPYQNKTHKSILYAAF
ncbi:MAG: hypothetical protein ACXV7J_05630 [Methylomonas sp.]